MWTDLIRPADSLEPGQTPVQHASRPGLEDGHVRPGFGDDHIGDF
jgi:hypothetical protein